MSAKKFSLVEILIWFVALLLALLVVSPFALGFKIKNDYAAMVQNMSDILQTDVRIVSYNRGFFTSDVRLEMQVSGAPMALQFDENIIHGPLYLGLIGQGQSPFVAAVINGKLQPGAQYQAQLQKMFNNQPPLQYQSIVDYSGNLVSQTYIPPVQAVIDQETGPLAISTSGMLFNSRYTAAGQALSGDGNLADISIDTDQTRFSAENLNINFAANMGKNGLIMGDSNLSLGKLDFQSQQDQLAIHDLRVRSMTSEVGALINSNVQMNAREIYASNERFGPATFNLSLNGLNANSLKQLQDMQKEVEAKLEQGIPPEQINAMVAGKMIALVPDLLKQADITIEPLKLESELGVLESTLNFSVEGLDQNAPADPMFMLSALNLDMDFNVDEALMRQIVAWYLDANAGKLQVAGDERAQQAEAAIPTEQKISENLQGMMDENWLTYTDGVYSSHITLHQGQMTLNDRQVDPMQQFMSQMPAPGAAGAPAP